MNFRARGCRRFIISISPLTQWRSGFFRRAARQCHNAFITHFVLVLKGREVQLLDRLDFHLVKKVTSQLSVLVKDSVIDMTNF